MHILVVGLDHHTSPVAVRERLAFQPSHYEPAYQHLLESATTSVREAVILSTCNRVEVYAVSEESAVARLAIEDFLHTFHDLEPETVTDALYVYQDRDAVMHLFSTACGLNSLVVGEPQIQAQVRNAAGLAGGAQALGPVLHGLFRHALEVGKRARTETNISRNAASISHAGVELARRLLGDLRAAHVLLVGSGEMSELAAKNLIDNGARKVTLVNRTVEHAQLLAGQWGGTALPFDALADALHDADVVISSTAAPHTVIQVEHVRAALADRPGRPLLLIDLAVPRDVAAEVAEVTGAFVYDIDDLHEVVATNLMRRREEVIAVEKIVDLEAERYLSWLSTRAVVPTLNRLREHAELISRAEIDRAMRRLPGLDDREREVVASLAAGIVNKLLHQPTVRLKQEAVGGNGAAYAEALQFLFGLETS
jgi:glutamyl-tRNA reductase